MYKVFTLVSLALLLISCESQYPNNKIQDHSNIQINKASVKTIKLYEVNTIFNRYMPDTSLTFLNSRSYKSIIYIILNCLKILPKNLNYLLQISKK